MRTQRRSILPTPSVALNLVSQTVMGIAMGLLFTLILAVADRSGVVRLVDQTADQGSVFVFVGTIVTTFGIGATLTGLILMMIEKSGPDC
jgi:hypothetical protein